MKTTHIIIGCISTVFLIILLILFILTGFVIYFVANPINIQPIIHVKPNVDVNMEPPNVHVHPRQTAFKCTNCKTKYYLLVKRRISFRCPNCGQNTLVPSDD